MVGSHALIIPPALPALLITLMKSSSPHREYNSRFDSDSKEVNMMTVDSQGTKARAVVGPYDDLSCKPM